MFLYMKRLGTNLVTKLSSVVNSMYIFMHIYSLFSGAHVALMTFADTPNDQYYFKDKQNIFSIQEAVQGLSHPGGGSKMVVAFKEARKLFSEAAGGRDFVTRVLVIATDADFYGRIQLF